jgi:hypothetical protein
MKEKKRDKSITEEVKGTKEVVGAATMEVREMTTIGVVAVEVTEAQEVEEDIGMTIRERR